MRIRIAHSPDSDDAFMFYALTAGKVETGNLQIEHVLADIETLNREALKGTYEVSALSFHAYPYVAELYLVLPSGGSVGEGYGPVVVSREPLTTLKGKKVAVPGTLTTAYLVLKLYEPNFKEVLMPFDQILQAVGEGQVEAGLVIHEGQLSYQDRGLRKVVDLGQWWKQQTGLPLPLGCNVVRKDLGLELVRKIESLVRTSVQYALDHREEALTYAIEYARDIREDLQKTDRFVGMYVNRRTLDYGEDGRQAVRLLLQKGIEKGIIGAPMPETIFSDEVRGP
ncbi:MAG: ABC transporter substrate-binding protein [Aquificaceae bacterium]|nr:ABC transporter substrate-binding protein [Aquificaceae bacterium]